MEWQRSNIWGQSSWKFSKADERHQEVPSILSKINAKKSTPKHFMVKLMKIKDKEEILKTIREQKDTLPPQEQHWLTTDSPT